MSNEVMWDPNPAGTLGPTPQSRVKKTIRVTTSATPGEIDSITDLIGGGVSSLRYRWALLKADSGNNNSNPIDFGHDPVADFDSIYPDSSYVDSGDQDQVLDFANLYVKSDSASQNLRIEYLEP